VSLLGWAVKLRAMSGRARRVCRRVLALVRRPLDRLRGRRQRETRLAGWWDLLPFTAHDICLPGGHSTAVRGVDPLADVRTKLVVEACGGTLEGLTLVDLGCLEGGFTLAFAQHGAPHALGIEARELSVRRCELARDLLGLDNAEFACSDVNDELARRDPFDVVFASGILYHVADPAQPLRRMRAVCAHMALIDTHVAHPTTVTHQCSELIEMTSGGQTYRGRRYREHSRGDSRAQRDRRPWSAWEDDDVFWPLEDDLVAMIRHAGFNAVNKIDPLVADRNASWSVDHEQRVIYIARP
jgi:SAM-dependent methyltransferase